MPRSVKTFHELEYRHLLYPRFGKYGEEEEWIFKADRKSNIMGEKSQSGPMAPLSLPCFLQTNVHEQMLLFIQNISPFLIG